MLLNKVKNQKEKKKITWWHFPLTKKIMYKNEMKEWQREEEKNMYINYHSITLSNLSNHPQSCYNSTHRSFHTHTIHSPVDHKSLTRFDSSESFWLTFFSLEGDIEVILFFL